MNQTPQWALDARRAAVMAMSRPQLAEAMRRRAWRDLPPVHIAAAAPAAPPPLSPAAPVPEPPPQQKRPMDMTREEYQAAVKARAWRFR
jgi:hypothetical protein